MNTGRAHKNSPRQAMVALCLFLCGGSLLCSCHGRTTLFRAVSPARSGIHFDNTIGENDSINPIDLEFMYNGGGVAVGDFNRDGLLDLYFTGSLVSNKLYLNKGGLRFADITHAAHVDGGGAWCNGATVVDINNDGWPDIYICASIWKDPRRRRNLLYVNQGCNADGIPVFREMAAEYGLADTSYSVQAAFFDYDNDGDLDMYLVTTKPAQRDAVQFSSNGSRRDLADVDKLYRNDWDPKLGHPVFTDVSASAGIVDPGYGLGVSIADINQDGWKDLYVTNDFLSSDLLYINNHDGTFTNKVAGYFKHTSQNAMGNAIADIDNDGLPDVLSVDMNPPDNPRKKTNLGGSNYTLYRNMMDGGYMLQYVRNTLQWNRGPRVGGEDSLGDPVFSEIGFYAGVAQTDWSWNPAIADFDNDGWRDILVTNGYPRDVTDHDFTAFRERAGPDVPKRDLIAQIPQVRIAGYAFKNEGGCRFEDVTMAWGLGTPSFSNGAVYVDLDNDGDLDYVVNNINGVASVYENMTNRRDGGQTPGYLDLAFSGDSLNQDGLGVRAEIYYGSGKRQVEENEPVTGYLSCVAPRLHFGLGSSHRIDSLVVYWGKGRRQVLRDLAADTLLRVDIRGATGSCGRQAPVKTDHPLLTDVTAAAHIDDRYRERDYVDFFAEPLLPHKLSQYGPGLAAGDIDGDGLDDLLVGASAGQTDRHYLAQQRDGRFVRRELPVTSGRDRTYPGNMGLLIFDADGDGYPDLYCASGGDEFPAGAPEYQDQLWMNDRHGGFRLDSAALPPVRTSKSCVKAADLDRDGDLDLFIGGRVSPGRYPAPANSMILRNDSKPGHPLFTDVTQQVAPGLQSIGMVCDAVWTDYDNDGWTDLIIVGEWMPVTFFHNDHGKLVKVTNAAGIGATTGWWNSIAAGDFDNDGDIDYIVGNLGENSFFTASAEQPMGIYVDDFDKNGSSDAILSLFLPDGKGHCREYPAASRDELTRQLPVLKKKYLTYAAFGNATIQDLFSPGQLAAARSWHANEMRSMYLENLGDGRFALHPLPMEAQLAPVYGMVVDDFDGDGNLDVALSGNDYGNEPSNGRYDAMNGLILLGNGRGGFTPQTIRSAGLFIPGDGKALVQLRAENGKALVAASQNDGALKLFRENRPNRVLAFAPGDRVLLEYLSKGKMRRRERYYGSSFLSQSAGMITVSPAIRAIEAVDGKGKKRMVYTMDKR